MTNSSSNGSSHHNSGTIGAVAGGATAANNNVMNMGANSSDTTSMGTGAGMTPVQFKAIHPAEQSFMDKSLARRAETGIDANDPSKQPQNPKQG